MTLCILSGAHCGCQPDEGTFCVDADSFKRKMADLRGECMRHKAEIAALEIKLSDAARHAEYVYSLYEQMKARVIELENKP